MSKGEIVDKLNLLLKDDEWSPNLEEKGWKGGKFKEVKKVEYKLTKKLLDFLNGCYKKIDDIGLGRSKQIIKYYTVYDNNIKVLGITDQTVKKAMIKQIIKKLNGDNSVLSRFPSIENLSFKLVLCTDKEKDDVSKTKKYLEKREKITKSLSIPYKTAYQDLLKELGYSCEKKNKSYIFKLTNQETGKTFIGGSKIYNKQKIIKSLASSYSEFNNDIKKLKHEFKFKFIKDFEHSTDTELLIELDLYNEKYGSMGNSYIDNRYCKKKLDKDKLFVDVNRELAKKNISDTYVYEGTNGFIYVVRNLINDKKYLGISKDSLDKVIDKIYKGKESKTLLEDLKQFPYSDFEFDIIKFKKNKDNMDLYTELGKLIERYKTDLTGYN